MKFRRSLILLSFCLFAFQNLRAELAHVRLTGTISAETGNGNYTFQPEEFPIQIWGDGHLIATHLPHDNGNYEINLPFGIDYCIRFGSGPWLVKMVEVHLKSAYFSTGNVSYTLQNNISLFRHQPDTDFEFLKNMPVAVADFDQESNCLTWNTEYSNKLTACILNTLRQSNHIKSTP